MADLHVHPTHIPEANEPNHQESKETLLNRLDDLLEKYLYTLDQYQKTRDQLSNHFSSAYFSLAQANFHNRSTTRYGQHHYDERMRAIRKVTIREEAEDELHFAIVTESKEEIATSGEKPVDEDEERSKSQEDNSAKGKKTTGPVDPLRWFGVLVPPALGSAQSGFVSAVQGPIPQLVNVSRELRRQEIEIGRVRKQIKKL